MAWSWWPLGRGRRARSADIAARLEMARDDMASAIAETVSASREVRASVALRAQATRPLRSVLTDVIERQRASRTT